MNTINDEVKPSKLIDLMIGAGLGVLSLIVYLSTLSVGAYPGESSNLIVEFVGLAPQFLPTHPLWGWLVSIVEGIPIGGIADRLNVLSAIFGAAVVWLIYDIMQRVVRSIITPDISHSARNNMAARISGIIASLYMAFSIPFWMLSTRAHTATFDLLLMLLCVRLFIGWLSEAKRWLAALIVFLLVVISAEFATAILLVPVLGVVILLRLWKMGNLNVLTYIWLALAGIAGLSIYFISTGMFVGSDGYLLREYTSYFHLLKLVLKYQYTLLAHSLPKEGWLIILFLTVVPWLTAMIIGRRGLNDEKDISFYILHIIMTALALLTLFNSPISPWPMLGEGAVFANGRILVTPYLLSATLFGYLVAYWFLLPSELWEKHAENAKVIMLRSVLGSILAFFALVAVLVMPFLNYSTANSKQVAFLDTYTKAVVNRLGGQKWLLADGSIDNQILIAAYDSGNPIKIISMPKSRSELYMRHVAAQFDSIRIKNLARLGLTPMLHEWISTDPNITADVAVQSMPDLWVGEGFVPVPNCAYFLGAKHDDQLAIDRIVEGHKQFWDEVLPSIADAKLTFEGMTWLHAYIVRQLGMVANNLGVFLEDNGREQEAFDSYAKAREIDPENISALLNQFAMVDRGFTTDQAEQIKTDMDDTIKGLDQKLHVWSLARYYGYVRMSQAFAQMGVNWAISGQPGLAVAGMKKAMELAPEENRKAMKQVLAGIYLADDDADASEKIYKDLLKDNPKDNKSLLGMVRIELSRGNAKEALVYLKKARKNGIDNDAVALEWASILSVHGNKAKARVVVNELLEKEKPPLKAWQLLVALLVQDKDSEELKRCIERMRIRLPENSVVVLMAEGNLAVMQNDLDVAREYFEAVLARTPKNQQVLNVLLKLDTVQGRMDQAEKHAHRLLLLDGNNYLANFITGSIQLQKGEPLLAEDSMRKALEVMRSPALLNDLAWVLQTLKKYDEAEKFAREAIERSSKYGGAYDTLGVILMKQKRYPEAEEMLDKALVMMNGFPDIRFHLAELHEKMGDKAKLAQDIKQLEKQQEYFSDKQHETLKKLKSNLK